jgi:site-specific DNA recombinase
MSSKNGGHDPLDLPPFQLRNLIRGIVWRDEHFDGVSIEDIAAREGLSKSGVRKIIMGSFDALIAL